ncbi:Clathrin light chain [Hypsizygus marmoreus]|uniref:Clathrin light chain n=1 Tax=Hypsizygus marmoreus TaxID=39966 RepID=A0A369JRS9_HYPMA|nr:Clathrin light chain [Hypsizygus marmoreus]
MSDLFNTSDEIDFDRAASAFPDISLDGEGDIPVATQTQAPPAASGFSFDDFDAPPAPRETAVKVTGDDELEKFQNEFPDIDVPHSQPPPIQSQASYGATFAPRPQPSAYSSTPILTQQIEEDEPQVIRDWREKQQAEIAARDEASKARRQETISKAERAIDEFYENYSAKKERNIRENKDQEAEYLANYSASLSSGTTWERICELIELQNSQSKTIARTGAGTTDLTRFKEVLLRLKREGDAAPGAGGY